ncbi:High-affinity Fe2+/Pb2+ permease [Richelia intracellularis HM01]|uniref:FTR1 family iron permease n=1 Tax=Richelia intracellularis TaxID=1164990 RepID=UPI0002B5AC01|nr:FTR1 family protein [Richelia intracellularis]CCH65741.1 High-affinity Fe2+/Pb2+ permease [Richelia intracellularis HM01]
MDFSIALPTFLITLRECVEAVLIIGIVLALLNKAGKSQLNSWVYTGIGIGIVISVFIGVLFVWLISTLGRINPQYSTVIEPLLEAIFCIFAITMLSWMLVWMRKQARFIRANVEGAVNHVLEGTSNGAWGIFSIVLIAVVREGFETVLFVAANFHQGLISVVGAFAGLFLATLIGILIFRLGIQVNIHKFFQVMGVLLILIIGGLVLKAFKNIDNSLANLALSSITLSDICFYYEHFTHVHSCILGPMIWNGDQILPEGKFPGIIFKSLFGYRDHLYLLQVVGYITFLLTISSLYFYNLDFGIPSKKEVEKLN